jgi:hypothetical protein
MGRAGRDDGPFVPVQHDCPVAYLEHAGQLVRDQDERGFQALVDAQHRIIELRAGNRIQARGWFVEKKYFRVQRHGPCKSSPFLHATAELGREKGLISRKTNFSQFQFDNSFNYPLRELRVQAKRQGHIFRYGHGAEQGSGLKQDADTSEQARGTPFRISLDAFSTDGYLALKRGQKTYQHLEKRALAATGSAEQTDYLASIHVE